MKDFYENAGKAVAEIARTLKQVDEEQLNKFIKAILEARRVFFTGMGRSGYVLRCVAQRFFHVGIDVHFVGDVNEPPIKRGDLLVVASASGEKAVPVCLARLAKKRGTKVACVGANPSSRLARLAGLFVQIPAPIKGKIKGRPESSQFIGSLFEQCLLVFGDTITLMIAKKKGVGPKALEKRHANLE